MENMHIILYLFRPFNGFYGCISYILPITYCLTQKHTPSMFLTDFRTRKYTRGIISRVGIFLTVTPDMIQVDSIALWLVLRLSFIKIYSTYPQLSLCKAFMLGMRLHMYRKNGPENMIYIRYKIFPPY